MNRSLNRIEVLLCSAELRRTCNVASAGALRSRNAFPRMPRRDPWREFILLAFSISENNNAQVWSSKAPSQSKPAPLCDRTGAMMAFGAVRCSSFSASPKLIASGRKYKSGGPVSNSTSTSASADCDASDGAFNGRFNGIQSAIRMDLRFVRSSVGR